MSRNHNEKAPLLYLPKAVNIVLILLCILLGLGGIFLLLRSQFVGALILFVLCLACVVVLRAACPVGQMAADRRMMKRSFGAFHHQVATQKDYNAVYGTDKVSDVPTNPWDAITGQDQDQH